MPLVLNDEGELVLGFSDEPLPGGGGDWGPVFAAAKISREMVDDAIAESLRMHEITSSAVEVSVLDLPKRTAIRSVAVLAVDCGWDVRCGRSETYSGDKVQKNGKVVRGKDETHYWAQGMKLGHRFWFSDGWKTFDSVPVGAFELRKSIMDVED